MTDIDALSNALVTTLRAIPDLVAALHNDATRISLATMATTGSLQAPQAVVNAKTPSLTIIYNGFGPGQASLGTKWKHEFLVYIRPPAGTGWANLARLIVSGVPTNGQGAEMLYTDLGGDCYPMDPPTARPVTDAQGVELGLLRLTYTEYAG